MKLFSEQQQQLLWRHARGWEQRARAAGSREREQHDEDESEEDEEEEERMGAGPLWCADADSPLSEASFRAGLKVRSRQVGTNFDPESFCPSGESRGSCRCAETRT